MCTTTIRRIYAYMVVASAQYPTPCNAGHVSKSKANRSNRKSVYPAHCIRASSCCIRNTTNGMSTVFVMRLPMLPMRFAFSGMMLPSTAAFGPFVSTRYTSLQLTNERKITKNQR